MGTKGSSLAPRTSADIEAYKQEIRDAIIRAMDTIPFADDSDAKYRMLDQILNGNDWESVATAENSSLPKAENVAGLKLKVYDITKRLSDIESPDDEFNLPYYLVLQSTNIDTGDTVVWQTSAATLVGKFIRAYTDGRLPITVVTSRSEKRTARGFYPMNMSVIE